MGKKAWKYSNYVMKFTGPLFARVAPACRLPAGRQGRQGMVYHSRRIVLVG